MANYPAAIDTFTSVAGTTSLATDDHAARHNATQVTIAGLQAVVGTTAGTSIAKNFAAGDFAVRINASNVLQQALTGTATLSASTLNNSTIGTSQITGGTVGTAAIIGGSIGTATITGGTIVSTLINTTDLRGYYSTAQATTVAAGGTAAMDLSLANEWRVTFGTGNATLAVSNGVNGQKFIVSLTQDAVGTRTATWFTTIRWTDGTAPTLTTTANKRDILGFIVTGSNTYDGIIIGQNI